MLPVMSTFCFCIYRLKWSGLGLGVVQFGTIEPKCRDGTGWMDGLDISDQLDTRSPYGDNNCCSFQKKVGHSQS